VLPAQSRLCQDMSRTRIWQEEENLEIYEAGRLIEQAEPPWVAESRRIPGLLFGQRKKMRVRGENLKPAFRNRICVYQSVH
jgi:hypothetical protein